MCLTRLVLSGTDIAPKDLDEPAEKKVGHLSQFSIGTPGQVISANFNHELYSIPGPAVLRALEFSFPIEEIEKVEKTRISNYLGRPFRALG